MKCQRCGDSYESKEIMEKLGYPSLCPLCGIIMTLENTQNILNDVKDFLRVAVINRAKDKKK